MNLVRLSASYIRRSGLATALNVVLLMLGVAHEHEMRLTRDERGIDLVLGAKGSPLQLVLSGVFHVDVPTGNIPLEEALKLRHDPRVAELIPVALGDGYAGFRIVGTEPAFVTHYGATLAAGRLWKAPLEAVLGADVAATTSLGIDAEFAGVHGLGGGGGEHAEHYRRNGAEVISKRRKRA